MNQSQRINEDLDPGEDGYGEFPTTLFHVAPSSYQRGDDVLPLMDRMRSRVSSRDPYDVAARYARIKWPGARDYSLSGDAESVSFFLTRSEASEYLNIDRHGQGKILEIDVRGLSLIGTGFDAGQYLCVAGKIDAWRVLSIYSQ